MLEVGQWFPSGVVEGVSFPQDEVLELAIVATLVQNSLYLILRFLRVEDLDRVGWWLDPALEVFWCLVVSLEKGDMEDRVDAQVVGESKTIGRG